MNKWKLLAYMEKKNLNQRKLAEVIGLSPHSLSNKMRGENEWKGNEIAEICRLLDIPESEIKEIFLP